MNLKKKLHALHHEDRSKLTLFEAINTRKKSEFVEKITCFTSKKSFKVDAFLKYEYSTRKVSLKKKSHSLHHENRSKLTLFETINTRKTKRVWRKNHMLYIKKIVQN